MAWDEDRLHRWLARRPRPANLVGSKGHDAAVLRGVQGRPVLCVDQTVEGVHFTPGTSAARVAAKACGRALSDLAATAATPQGLLLSLRAGPEVPETWLKQLMAAIDRRGQRFGAPLVGGDLCCAPGPMGLSVTALGHHLGRRRPVGRDRARPGDLLLITGPVGGSSLGAHLLIEPRLAEGRWLAKNGARALMDVSDGLAWDLFRLARAAGVAAHLEEVPVSAAARRLARSSGRAPAEHALHDGEDHELLAALPPRQLTRLLAGARRHCPELRVIGRFTTGQGLVIGKDAAARAWKPSAGEGWRHGT
ncbi:MAG: thiamine-phosphate kinase [Planctomycetota bacterium]|nr:thiamine-phosphate kinase [Planctomycetota bacterium]